MKENAILFKEFVEYANSLENLDEGIISAIKGKLISMSISILPEKMLDKVINKAFTKAMSKAETPEQKQKLMDLRQEMLSMDKKAKKLKLKTLIKKAPQKDIAAAELKLRAELKKTGKIQESVLFEGEYDDVHAAAAAAGTTAGTDAYNAAYSAHLANNPISAEGYEAAVGARNTEIGNLNNSLNNTRTWAMVATIVAAVLLAALIAVVVHNVNMGY